MSAAAEKSGGKPRKEIYTYTASSPALYALAASARAGPEHAFRYAVGSFVEEYSNRIEIVQVDDEAGDVVQRSVFDHNYPATRILWAPEPASREKDLLATAGDYLRMWRVRRCGGGGAAAQPRHCRAPPQSAPASPSRSRRPRARAGHARRRGEARHVAEQCASRPQRRRRRRRQR